MRASSLTAQARTLWRLVMVVIAAVVFVSDRVTKLLAERRIHDGDVVTVIPGFFNLISTKNSGAVFGLFSESTASWKTPLLVAVSVALLVVVVLLVIRTQNVQWQTRIGLSLILGGAVSNLLDRVRTGRVEDFLDFYVRSYHWATFNLADSAIVVGTAFIAMQVLFAE